MPGWFAYWLGLPSLSVLERRDGIGDAGSALSGCTDCFLGMDCFLGDFRGVLGAEVPGIGATKVSLGSGGAAASVGSSSDSESDSYLGLGDGDMGLGSWPIDSWAALLPSLAHGVGRL